MGFKITNQNLKIVDFMLAFQNLKSAKVYLQVHGLYNQSLNSNKNRVAIVRENFWKMKNFPGQGKVREFHFQ